MDCKRAQFNLTAYDDKELAGSEALEIKNHLEQCQSCTALRLSLSETWKALDLLPVEEPDAYAAIRFLNRRKPAKVFPVFRWAMAATFMVMLTIGSLMTEKSGMMNPSSNQPEQAALTSSLFPDLESSGGGNDKVLFEAIFDEADSTGNK